MALMKNKDLRIGNLGDCRVVPCTDGTKAKEVSADHAAHGICLGDHVAVSRAFGNVHESGENSRAGVTGYYHHHQRARCLNKSS